MADSEPITDEQLAQMRRTVESDLPFSGRKRLIARLDAAERQLETAHTIMAINEQAYTERVCELHAAEAECERLRAAVVEARRVLARTVELHIMEGDRWNLVENAIDAINAAPFPSAVVVFAAPPDPKEPSHGRQ